MFTLKKINSVAGILNYNENFKLQEDYLSFMTNSNKNEINSENLYIQLYSLNDLEEINEDYETEKLVPNHFVIGTNGAGVGIFVKKSNNNIYSIPLIGMEEKDAVLLADSFSEFLNKFKKGVLEIY